MKAGSAGTRTVRLATLPLTRAKRDEIHALLHAYAEAKDAFLVELGSTKMWHHLDARRGFRDSMKEAGAYLPGAHVHLVDQAAFDAVDTWVRHLEGCLATRNVKQKVYQHFADDKGSQALRLCLSEAVSMDRGDLAWRDPMRRRQEHRRYR